MGKTTLCRKIWWDWARKEFTAFSIAFLVYLRKVKPNKSIEDVIIEQNPILEELRTPVTPAKIRNILRKFGNRCLLILDGYDEYDRSTNEEVSKIINGEKYLFCNLIVTSRPHRSSPNLTKFSVVRIEGFNRDKAKQCASKILKDDERKIRFVLSFNPLNFIEDVPFHKCPILFSFLCLSVKENEIDLVQRPTHNGEIYTKMVFALYKKYTIRKEVEFESSEFMEIVRNIGKLALKTLLSEHSFLKRSEVIKEVGKDAFDYGLLIGDDDFRSTDVTHDIVITFPHPSIQMFLGALYFVLMLDGDESIETLLDGDCRKPIFMEKPLFLHFCLWFLCSDQEYFPLKLKRSGLQNLENVLPWLNKG